MDWILDSIRARIVEVQNPRRTTQVKRISLDPTHVRAWVWWSKDYARWIQAYQDEATGPLLRQYDAHIFNFTINGEGHSFLEPGLRTTLDERLGQLAWLAATFGPDSIVLRFDPIVHYRINGPVINNLGEFQRIAQFASACGIRFIVVAFAIPYAHIRTRLRGRVELIDPPPPEKRAILERLRDYVRELSHMQIRLCCLPVYGDIEDIGISSCINGEQINEILARNGKAPLSPKWLKKDGGQRDSCHCTKSVDIGGYGPAFACEHSCIYCYANPKN